MSYDAEFTSQILSEYVRNAQIDLSNGETRSATLRCVLDLMTAAAAGVVTPNASGLRHAAFNQYGDGPAQTWFAGRKMSTSGAIFCNSMAASVLDLDDGHRAARGHPGAAVIPTAFALAAEMNSTAEEVLEAIVVGYEVAVRVAAASAPPTMGYGYGSGRWCGYGAIAAAGRLRRTDPEAMSQAFAIGGVTSPNLTANGSAGYSNFMGNDVKEAIPWATVTAVTALYLAEAGLVGPKDILDHAPHYNRDLIADGLGGPPAIRGVYFKPFSSCRYVHPAVNAFDEIIAAHPLSAREIKSVEVHTFQWALDIGNLVEPKTLIDVQYSIPYCIGLSALLGSSVMLPITDDVLNRRDVSEFARKVTLHLDPELQKRCPGETVARVIVRTEDENFESPVTTPRGEASNPMSMSDLEDKFRVATRAVLQEAQQEQILHAVNLLGEGKLEPLVQILGQPLDFVD